ncbi:DUF1835 domain-containing protein [Paludifilum halophilum]|uniref:DUF1835 domain-containing protein n=1 Tax=Paludifilum halophilum TaxID=1642702 RepID=UPI00146BAAD0|nr:DUF1835 domain-containing protein [Paludifilum halophilum]
MIHIVNGDVLGERLRDWEGMDGEVFVWREMYDLGPLSRQWTVKEQLRKRAAFFEERLGLPAEQMLMVGRYQEQRLEMIPRSSRVVLWFSHDRYDQMMLLYLLTRFRSLGLKQLEMITPDGLEMDIREWGSFSSDRLEQLYRHRKSVKPEQLDQAASAWEAYLSTDPRNVQRWLAAQPRRLPHIHNAFRIHLQYFPSVFNGLNEVEHFAMHRIREGVTRFSELHAAVSRERQQDGLSDFHFAALLNELSSSQHPLVRIQGPICRENGSQEEGCLELTALGREVLDGKKDRIRSHGIDWWLGGVHLTGGQWRRNRQGFIVEGKE